MIRRLRPLRPLRPPSPRRLSRQRSRWPALAAALAALAAGAWFVPHLVRDGSTDEAVAAGPGLNFDAPIGERLTGARCFMVVVDESASMADADATGARADAVSAATDFLSAYGLADDRIGTTWFADSADVVAPHPVTSAAGKVVDTSGLGTGTNIADALQAAVAAMDADCAAAKHVIVLVSDGQASSQTQFDSTADLIAGAGADLDLHVIAMNGNQAFESARAFWEDPALGIDSIEPITSFGADEVAAAMAKVLTLETGQQVTASNTAGTTGS